MTLFQNLSPCLAEEIVSNWRPFCSKERNGLSNFGRGVNQEAFLYNYFKIHPLVREKKSLQVILFSALADILFNEGGWFEWNDLSNFLRGLPKEHSCEIIIKSVYRLSRSCLKLFLFIALVAILFNRVKRFEQFW